MSHINAWKRFKSTSTRITILMIQNYIVFFFHHFSAIHTSSAVVNVALLALYGYIYIYRMVFISDHLFSCSIYSSKKRVIFLPHFRRKNHHIIQFLLCKFERLDKCGEMHSEFFVIAPVACIHYLQSSLSVTLILRKNNNI